MSNYSNDIELVIDRRIALIKIKRSKKLNCLTMEMLQQLSVFLDQIEDDADVLSVVIQAEPGKAFCAGADIQAWKDLDALDMWRTWVKKGHQVFNKIEQLRQPVIASVTGLALGGGLELAAAADVRIASLNTQFALPEASIATCPGWSGSQRLVKEIGPAWVKAMAIYGKWWTAEEALNAGFVQSVAEDYQSTCDLAIEWALKAAALAPVSVQLNKQLINAAMGIGISSTLEAMASGLSSCTQDAIEGKNSFFEKRTPVYKGR